MPRQPPFSGDLDAEEPFPSESDEVSISSVLTDATLSSEVEKLLSTALSNNVTDLHLGEGRPPTFRVARVCKKINAQDTITSYKWEEVCNALFQFANLPTATKKFPKKFSFNYDNKRIRVVSYTTTGTRNLCLRFQPIFPPELTSLGFSDALYNALTDPTPGLVLISGGPCSGKSTTFASILSYFNKLSDYHIRTLESPIEYMLPSDHALITQQQIGDFSLCDSGSYYAAVEESLLQDVNIMGFGEIRDLPTLQAAIKAANLNLLVFATIHAPDVAGTIGRVAEEYPESDRKEAMRSLRRCLKVILTQRLIPDNTQSAEQVSRIDLKTQAGVFYRNKSLKDMVTLDKFVGITGKLLENPDNYRRGCVNGFPADEGYNY